jgi:hypothetical protein
MPDGLSLNANCSTVTIAASVKKAPAKTEVRCSFDSAQAALEFVLAGESPNIIAFGETHPKQGANDLPTSLMFFADQLLPLLQQRGYNDLVLESLMSGSSADLFPPNSINNKGAAPALIRKAQELRLNIYGGGPSHHDQERFDIYDQNSLTGSRSDRLFKKITRRTKEQVLALLKHGEQKVITYNGGLHNDIAGDYQKAGLSFGKFFRGNTRYKYTELDILTPELMDKGRFDRHTYPEYADWLRSAVPQKGVMLIQRVKGSYTIILPAGTLAP